MATSKSTNIKSQLSALGAEIQRVQAHKQELQAPAKAMDDKDQDLLEAMRLACADSAERYLESLQQEKGRIVSKIGRK